MNLSTLLAHRDDSPSAEKEMHVSGLPITIERPRGTMRILHDDKGKVVYRKVMMHHYGYFNNTKGRDGDEVDVFVGPLSEAKEAYVIHMIDKGPNPSEREDEDKVMLGFPGADAAKAAFLAHYPISFYGGMTALPMDAFKRKLSTAQLPYRKKMITAGSFHEWNAAVKKAKCPKCGSKLFTLMPSDFETAKCQNCGKLYEISASAPTPASVHYTAKADNPAETCKKCRFMRSHNNCTVLDKIVNPQGWCDRWRAIQNMGVE